MEPTPGLPATEVAPKPARALALDALRGLAILMMCLSGLVHDPVHELPHWMFHAQVPPGTGYLGAESRPGITWVDLVFPMFLFAMGAAFPLALRRRVEQGTPMWRLLVGTLGRGASLVAFAIYVEQLNPWRLRGGLSDRGWASAATQAQLATLVAFGLLFLVYARLPERWTPTWRRTARTLGIAGAAAWLYLLRVPAAERGTWQSLHTVVAHTDIIILVLANMAVFGAVIWLFTRDHPGRRYAVLAIWFGLLTCFRADAPAVLADGGAALAEGGARLTAGNWLRDLLTLPRQIDLGDGASVPLGFFFHFDWTKYLFVVIPGTLVGDQLLTWMRLRRESEPAGTAAAGFGPVRLLALSLLALGLVVGLTAALYGWRDPATMAMQRRVPLAAAGGCLLLWPLLRGASSPGDRFLRGLCGQAAFWLALGLLFEPAQGGIRKDPSFFGYYFVTAALSIFALVALTVWIDRLGYRRPFMLAVWSGQNPMIAYMGIRSLLGPLRELPLLFWTSETRSLGALASSWITGPWGRALWGGVQTLLLALGTAWLTRRRIFWRT